MAKNKGFNKEIQEIRRLQPSTESLKSGILIRQTGIVATIYTIINPFIVFTIDGILQLLQSVEVATFNESKHNLLRESSLNIPGLSTLSQRPVVEDNVLTNTSTGKVTRSETRERGRYGICFSLIIWITGFLLAHAPEEIRTFFTTRILQYGYVPKFYSELFKRTRRSFCGNFLITPSVVKNCSKHFLLLHPIFKGTIIDPSVLYTVTGVNQLIGILAYLYNSPGNYIPFVEASTQTVPSLDATYTTTFCSIGVTDISNMVNCYQPGSNVPYFTNCDLYLIPGNAYGKTVHSTHIADATFVAQTHSRAQTTTQPKLSNLYNSLVVSGEYLSLVSSTNMLAQYIVQRTTGIEENPGYEKGKSSDINTRESKRKEVVPTLPDSSAFNYESLASLIKGSTVNEVRDLIRTVKSLVNLFRSKRNRTLLNVLIQQPAG